MVSAGKSVVKPYLASFSEENFVAESDFTYDKSIVECTDYSSKSTINGDASTTMETLASASEENVVSEYYLTSFSSDKSIVECTDSSSKSTSSGDASTTMAALALASEYNVVAKYKSTSSDKSILMACTLFSPSPSGDSTTTGSTILL